MQEDKPPLKHGDIHPAHVLIEEYGFTSETALKIEVVAEDVPKKFHDLIPLVEKWAISCDVRRGDFYDKQAKEEITEFYNAELPHENRTTRVKRIKGVHVYIF